MTVEFALTVDDQTIDLTVDDPYTLASTADPPFAPDVTVVDPDTIAVTTSLQLPQPPPWEVYFEATATLDAEGDTVVTSGEVVLDGSGELRAVLPASWGDFIATYPTWGDRNGLTWAQLTALES